ncbi:MAG: 50S ribosomal protein L11 methyltransferase [Lachnospiraceae bacterium]|nr:50S ribosomal protein L11 methyltransferase [Lachnospiraceae bacterium]
MRYNKYTIQTTTEAEDILISALYDIGIEGAQIEDKIPLSESEKAGMFVDIMPETAEDDGIAYISFYLDETEDTDAWLKRVREELDDIASFMDAGTLAITTEQTEDADFLNNWKQYFHQFTIDDILIVPSWEEAEAGNEDKMIVHIDPGTAFGTGMHETTQLCIRALKKHVTDKTALLDVGTGSGILAIMAYKFGAKFAMGTDLDLCAVDAVKDNMEANGLTERQFKLLIGNIIDDPAVQEEVGYEKYDIVTANILAEVLIPLTPVIMRHLKPGGIYITSGIIDDKEEAVKRAEEEAGLKILEINHQGEWVGITARKPV